MAAEVLTHAMTQLKTSGSPLTLTPIRTMTPPSTFHRVIHEITEHVSPSVQMASWGLNVGERLDISDTELVATCTVSCPGSPKIGNAANSVDCDILQHNKFSFNSNSRPGSFFRCFRC